MFKKLMSLNSWKLLLLTIGMVISMGIALGLVWTIASWIQFHIIIWLHLYNG